MMTDMGASHARGEAQAIHRKWRFKNHARRFFLCVLALSLLTICIPEGLVASYANDGNGTSSSSNQVSQTDTSQDTGSSSSVTAAEGSLGASDGSSSSSQNSSDSSGSDSAGSSGSTQSGETNIATHKLSWVGGSNSSTIDGDSISLTPYRHRGYQEFATLRISFSLGGEQIAKAGQIKIRIPAHIFYDYQGNPTGTVQFPIPEAPETGGNTTFNYSYDSATDEYVISNYAEVTGSYNLDVDVKYSYTSPQVPDGYTKDDICASFVFDPSDGADESKKATAVSNDLSVNLDTAIGTVNTDKEFITKFETWRDSWGEKPADADDYFYVVWKVSMHYSDLTSRFNLYGTEELDKSDGEYVGCYTTTSDLSRSSLERLHFDESDRMQHDEVSVNNYPNDSNSTQRTVGYILMRYPRSLITQDNPTPTVTNYFTSTKESIYKDADGKPLETYSNTDSASYSYVPPVTQYPGDKFSISKSIPNYYYASGATSLAHGHDVRTGCWWVNITDRGYDGTKDENGTYGKNEYSTVLVDDTFFLEDERLQPGDYSIDSVHVGVTEVDMVQTDEGITGKASVDYSNYRPIDFYIKIGSGEYQKFGTVTFDKDGNKRTYKLTKADGSIETNNSGLFDLPDNVTAYKLVHTGKNYETDFNCYSIVTFHGSDHMKQILGENPTAIYPRNVASGYQQNSDGSIVTGADCDNGSYNYLSSKAKQQVEEQDQALYGQRVPKATDAATLTGDKGYSDSRKDDISVATDVDNSCVRIHYRLKEADSFSFGGAPFTRKEVLESGIINNYRNGIFYDLLPKGTTIDASTIKVTDARSSQDSSKNAVCDFTVEQQENWRGSGRTMVMIHVTNNNPWTDEDETVLQSGIGSSARVESGFFVEFDLIDTWENIADNGSKVVNGFAYRSLDDGDLASGRSDNGGYIDDREWYTDLDGNGLDPSVKKFGYAQVSTSLSEPEASEAKVTKTVKAPDEALYTSSSQVPAAGSYRYRLHFSNDHDYLSKDAVFYDVLETANPENFSGKRWQGTFEGIDVSDLVSRGIAPVVYYSTSTDWGNLSMENEYGDLTDTTRWSTTPPDDLSKVTAVAIDASKNTDGSDHIFEGPASATVYIDMRAPGKVSQYLDDPETDADETVYAYNSIYTNLNRQPKSGGTWAESIDECQSVRVSLREPDVTEEKPRRSRKGRLVILPPKCVPAAS
ncbi:MAG: hypothetical protein ACOX1O_00680 [Eggerthellaceae bacterium]|jgi:hypothetical protein